MDISESARVTMYLNFFNNYSQLRLLWTLSGLQVSVLNSETEIPGIYFSQTSVIYFCWG